MIVVTGMHRSGTSCIAELLKEVGLPFSQSEPVREADRFNARGYFEERAIVDLNARLVSGQPWRPSGPRRWLGLVAYLSMPSLDRIARRAASHSAEIQALADARRGHLVKDPRFCLTLPSWRRFGSVSACVVCLRDPREVAGSLARRQRVPVPLGLRLWRYHAEALLPAVPPRTLVLDYDALLGADPGAELARIAAFFDVGAKVDLEEVHARVCAPELFHAKGGGEPLPTAVQSTWEAWLRMRDASGSPISSETK